MVFCVGKRRLTTGEYSHSFIGEYSDILQISIDFDYKENIQKKDTAPVADKLYFNTGNRQEGVT